MWYTGIGEDNRYTIGYATSSDGVNWTRVNGPNINKSVFEIGAAGSFNENQSWTPSVVTTTSGYIMLYSGRGSRSYSQNNHGAGGLINTIGYAISKDGIHWDKVTSSGPGGCSLDASASAHFDEDSVLTPSILWNGAALQMWYGGSSRTGLRLIGHATASPGMEYLFSLETGGEGDIGYEGGTVSIDDPASPVYGASVTVPAGVLETLTTITIGEFTGDLPPMDNGAGIGVPIHFGPEGIDFSPHTVTIEIPYTPEALADAGIDDPNLLDVFTFDPETQQWELVEGMKTVDTLSNLVMIEVSHFSVYQLGIAVHNFVLEVPVDIKPRACPNRINVNIMGVLPVAVLGTNDFDVSMIKINSIRLMGIAPLRAQHQDVGTPYTPYVGKEDASDCNEYGPDGIKDLVMQFDVQPIIRAIETFLNMKAEDGDVITLPLEGKLLEEYGGSSIRGEDVIVIQKKGKKK
jgi:hypothetical protein